MIAVVGCIGLGEPVQDHSVRATIANAPKLLPTNDMQGVFGLLGRGGLPLDVAVGCGVVREQFWRDRLRDTASGAAAIHDVEGPSTFCG
jgi:hypothetical protein